jgi:hypothetical protein
MHVTGFEITLAWLADLAFGDPQWIPYPALISPNETIPAQPPQRN